MNWKKLLSKNIYAYIKKGYGQKDILCLKPIDT